MRQSQQQQQSRTGLWLILNFWRGKHTTTAQWWFVCCCLQKSAKRTHVISLASIGCLLPTPLPRHLRWGMQKIERALLRLPSPLHRLMAQWLVAAQWEKQPSTQKQWDKERWMLIFFLLIFIPDCTSPFSSFSLPPFFSSPPHSSFIHSSRPIEDVPVAPRPTSIFIPRRYPALAWGDCSLIADLIYYRPAHFCRKHDASRISPLKRAQL